MITLLHVHVQLLSSHKFLLKLSASKFYLASLQWLEDSVKLPRNLTDYGRMQLRESVREEENQQTVFQEITLHVYWFVEFEQTVDSSYSVSYFSFLYIGIAAL